MKMFWGAVASAAAIGAATPANAGLLIDMSPDATGLDFGLTMSNIASAQNFLMKITLSKDTTLNGIDIYSDCVNSGCGGPNIGTGAVVKIRNDVAGKPDSTNIFLFNTLISEIDSSGSSVNHYLKRIHADFSNTFLSAGDYWIGLSGDNTEIGLSLPFASSPYPLYLLGGDALYGDVSSSFGSAGFRIYAETDTSAVPEPATWAMMLAGFGAVGFALRRRQRVAVSFA